MRAAVFTALVLAVLATGVSPAQANMRPPYGYAPGRVGPAFGVQQGMLPLDRILPAVSRTVPGRILDVQVQGATYRVKVLRANGRVSYVLVDGRTGQVLRVD
jgi:uncharacterized membrane protein YkoI